ncbi:MAG: phenylalanine--tRNA ligase subunit alpha, partial [Gilliamella sp.]|nr:phenylalanine--tRNA ligase subunit alpha [Gilliamella sp.]
MSQLVELVNNAKSAIESANDINSIEQIRVEYFGKKGYFTMQMASLRDVPADERPSVGQKINDAK